MNFNGLYVISIFYGFLIKCRRVIRVLGFKASCFKISRILVGFQKLKIYQTISQNPSFYKVQKNSSVFVMPKFDAGHRRPTFRYGSPRWVHRHLLMKRLSALQPQIKMTKLFVLIILLGHLTSEPPLPRRFIED